jgi:prolyl-tRNA synthetase
LVPNWDRFAGSEQTVDGYVLLPGGRAMELFTTAYLGTRFSEIFDITFLDNHKKEQYAHLLCYGPSIDRILASIIAILGDDRGLRLLSSITPIDIAIVPIFNRQNKEAILTLARKVAHDLTKMSFKVQLEDGNETTPGAKFYKTERLGIPLRIEIGKMELQNNTITLVRRDTLKKESITYNKKTLKKILQRRLKSYDRQLKKAAFSDFQKNIVDYSNEQSLLKKTTSHNLRFDRMYLFGWCGTKKCAQKIEEETAFTVLGFDYATITEQNNCQICNKKGKKAILAKRY